MSALDFLKAKGILFWDDLLIGFKNWWCEKDSFIEYATNLLMKSNEPVDANLACIAAGEFYSDQEIVDMAIKLLGLHGSALPDDRASKALEKWRFAHVASLLGEDITDEEKIDELQEIYAMFGFPDDMADCSIYNQEQIGPLEAARSFVYNMSKFFIEPE